MALENSDLPEFLVSLFKGLKEGRERVAKELSITFDLPDTLDVSGEFVVTGGVNGIKTEVVSTEKGKTTVIEVEEKGTEVAEAASDVKRANEGGTGRQFGSTTETSGEV